MQEFADGREFERTFFFSLLDKPKKKKVEAHVVIDLPTPLVQILNQSEFNFDSALSEDICELEMSLDKGTILKSNNSKIFGKIVTELIAKGVKFETLVHKDLVLPFRDFTKELIEERRPLPLFTLIEGDKKKLWVIEIDSRVEGSTKYIVLKNLTTDAAKAMGRGPKDDQKGESAPKVKPLDIVFFKYTNVDTETKKWVTRTATLLKKANLWPNENRTKFIALRYEDDSREKAEFNHPFIDDLICLPIDRLIFLQKVELALALPKKTTPTFLYVQNVNDPVEMSKKILIERVNDLGLATANPIPLAQGTVGHFYFRFPGQKQLLDVYAKVSTSHPHPDREGEYLSYFHFFGLQKNPLKEIKAYLSRDSAFKGLIDMDPSNFKYNPDNLFITDVQKLKKTVLLLDYDEAVLKNTADYLKKEVDHIDVVADDTYYGFYRRYLAKSTIIKAPSAVPEDFFVDLVSMIIDSTNLRLQMMITPPTEGDKFLGHETNPLLTDPEGWHRLINEDSRNHLVECLHLTRSAKRLHKNFELLHADGTLRTVALEFINEEESGLIRINFKLPENKASMSQTLQSISSLDCVIVDYDLLPEDINAFLSALNQGIQSSGLRTSPTGPKIIVTATENRKVDLDRLLNSKVFAFVYKPIEIRRLLHFVALALDTPYTLYNAENVGWKKDTIPAKIARKAQMIELSEFGAAIVGEQPIKPGTMLYLFKSIFENAPDQNLCTRVYHSQEDDSQPGQYINSLVYFGITDAFLKYTRAYIRETYAHKKASESKGS